MPYFFFSEGLFLYQILAVFEKIFDYVYDILNFHLVLRIHSNFDTLPSLKAFQTKVKVSNKDINDKDVKCL